MKNPFQYGAIVGGDDFCNRRQEIADLVRAMGNGEKLLVYSERRLGKTSLVLEVLKRLPRDRFLTVYVDLWPTEGAASFATTVAKALVEATATRANQLLQGASRLFSRLRPALTVGEDGKPVLTFGSPDTSDLEPGLEEVLAAPQKLTDGRQVVVVFDEVQRLAEYDNDRVERHLRSAVQRQPGVAYLFLGSRKHLLQRMFLDSSRPLYRSTGHYPLQPIDLAGWRPFIEERFREAGKLIGEAQIAAVFDLTQGHPFYTQHLCHALWEQCPAGGEVTPASVDDALALLLDREHFAYSVLWESLTLNQQRFVRGLATEPLGSPAFSSDFVRRHGLRTPSNAQRAAESLLARDVVDRDNGSFILLDRFFRLWIGRRQGAQPALG